MILLFRAVLLSVDMTTVLTACTRGRKEYIQNLHRSLEIHSPHVKHLVVVVGDKNWSPWDEAWTIHLPRDGSFNLAQARNAAFNEASRHDDKLIWLDADCVVGKDTIPLYEAALEEDPDAIAVGPATWLNVKPSQIKDHLEDIDLLRNSIEPCRRFPEYGKLERFVAGEYWLMYGLSFGMTSEVWKTCVDLFGGFCEEFEGWGYEDIDFGYCGEQHGVPKTFVGGAFVYHQWHKREWPPLSYMQDVVDNSNLFFERHGFSRVDNLRQLEDLGLIEISERGEIRVLKDPAEIPQWVRDSTVVREDFYA